MLVSDEDKLSEPSCAVHAWTFFYSAITMFAFTSSVNLLQSTPVAGDLVLGQRGQQHSQMGGKKADWENREDKNGRMRINLNVNGSGNVLV